MMLPEFAAEILNSDKSAVQKNVKAR